MCSIPAFCTLPATLQWDVRTGGADTNGGGFDPSVTSPGTDYSQQNSAQIAYTDLVIGATTTQYTSVLNVVSSALVGNTIQIVSGVGCTTGFYNVRSVATITATVDRSMGTAASVCTANLGGSLLTVAEALAAVVAGNTVNIKSGTYTLTATLVVPNLASLTLIGYNATHADGGTKPLITTATNSTDLIDLANSSSFTSVLDNLSLSNTAGTPANGAVKTNSNGPATIRNCKLSGFTNGINGDNVGAHYIFTDGLTVFNTEIANCSAAGVVNDSGGLTLISHSYIHGNITYGVEDTDSGQCVIVDSVLDSNGYGFLGSSFLMVAVNSVFSNSTHDGVNMQQTNSFWGSINSIYYGNGGYGSANTNTGTYLASAYVTNAYGSNTLGNTKNWIIPASASAGDVSLSADPFVSSSNFALNGTAGGGAALKAVGFPGVTFFGTGYLSIGPLQPQGSSGGGNAAWVQ